MKVIDLLKKIENGENIPQKIKVYQEVFEWDILEHYYKRSNGDDLLELCTIFNTGELLSMEVELIEDEIDIDSIGELKSVTNNIDGTVCIMNKINELVQTVKQINKEVKEMENKMNGNDNGFTKNRNKEKQRQNNVREYQRKFLNKKTKRGK